MKGKVLLAEGFEEIEAITLIDILRRADYEIKTVSISHSLEVKGSHTISVIADELLENTTFTETDAIILPGGVPGVPNLASNKRVLGLVKEFSGKNKHIIAICAAPYILDKAGVLKGTKITCYPAWAEMIKNAVITTDNVVVSDNIITGKGVGAAIDLALKVIEIFSGKEKSLELKEKIVYKC